VLSEKNIMQRYAEVRQGVELRFGRYTADSDLQVFVAKAHGSIQAGANWPGRDHPDPAASAVDGVSLLLVRLVVFLAGGRSQKHKGRVGFQGGAFAQKARKGTRHWQLLSRRDSSP
jgi:hypothetical protein